MKTMFRSVFLTIFTWISGLYHPPDEIVIVSLHLKLLFYMIVEVPSASCLALGRVVRKSNVGGGRLSICGFIELKVLLCFKYCFYRFLLSRRRLAAIIFHIFDYKM